MRAIFTPTVFRNNTPNTPIANHPLRHILLLALLALTSVSIKAADYVFTYNNGYLAVDNNGNITYANTFNPQCIWTCVSNTGTLAGANLDANNSRFLYTTVGNTKYWLVGSTTNGAAITTTTTAPGTANWRAIGCIGIQEHVMFIIEAILGEIVLRIIGITIMHIHTVPTTVQQPPPLQLGQILQTTLPQQPSRPR